MRPKLYLFGDSITEESFDNGWGSSLANHFSRTVDVVLRGFSGYNTRWALKVLHKVFPFKEETESESPLAITVFFGANDACLPDRYAGFQHVPIHEFNHNLRSIVSFLKSILKGANKEGTVVGDQKRWPQTVIVLITPPPIDEDARLLYPYVENPLGLTERTNEVAGAYAKSCVAVARECGVQAIDLWTKMQELPGWQKVYLRPVDPRPSVILDGLGPKTYKAIDHHHKMRLWFPEDGLHLTQSGNQVVFEEVLMRLTEAGISLGTLKVDLPSFVDIDKNDPLKHFDNC
ncbi:hypothetical protein ACFE04_020144 [Oxalis oulophora]